MSPEPQSLVLELLRNIRADVARLDLRLTRLKQSLNRPKRNCGPKSSRFAPTSPRILLRLRKETSEQIAGLRRAVVEYHSAVLGHGVLISELEARVRRIEQHLSLPSIDAI